jgi:aryl-alcohol dehydrogenase-like predicted oxidoreductase
MNGNGNTIEREIERAALMNGSKFARNRMFGSDWTIAAVQQGVALAVQKALALGLLTDEEKERTQFVADQRAEAEQQRREKLEEEEAKLRAELEQLDAEVGEEAE